MGKDKKIKQSAAVVEQPVRRPLPQVGGVPQAFVFFAAVFSYFYFRIDPTLIYQSQQPVFFFDRLFFQEFTHYPGGLLQWMAALLGQFYFHAFTGALMPALLFTAVFLLFRALLRTTAGTVLSALPWLPLPLLLLLYSRYDFPLTVAVGLLLSLLLAALFFQLKPANRWGRIALFALLFILLHCLAAGPALFFALIVAIDELLRKKSPITATLMIALAAVLPWLSAQALFVVLPKDAYWTNLEFGAAKTAFGSSALLWALIPAIVVLNLFYGRFEKAKGAESSAIRVQKTIGVMAVIVLTLLAAFAPPDQAHRRLLQLDRAARRGDWKAVLACAQGDLANTYIGQFQTNRALYHSGRLCDDMFSFEQRAGMSGLFMHESIRANHPLQYSDLFFELGLINEAQHWAHEALSVTGDTPWNLQRLAEVYLLKGEKAAAQKCLNLLKRTIWHKNWAQQFEKNLSQETAHWPAYLQNARRNMLGHDFLITPAEPELCLDALSAANPNNRMAYEYSLAACLILGKVGRLMNLTDRIQELGYRRIPRHAEEAMLMFISNVGLRDHKVPSFGFSPATVQKFNQFLALTEKHKGDKSAALAEMRKLDDTYWFYAMYRLKKQ